MPNPRLTESFFNDRRGVVFIMFALSITPAILLLGLALDYQSAIRRKNETQQAADSAAIAAASNFTRYNSVTKAQAAGMNMFNAQLADVKGLTFSAPTVTIAQNGASFTVTVAYAASSTNLFGGALGKNSSSFTGQAASSGAIPPNIDYYMLLDNSPSMALPATTAGINTMVANTPQQNNGNGCAFACHETQWSSYDTPGNATNVDNWALAQQLGVVTRIENVATATKAVASAASSVGANNGATYRMGVYTFGSQNLGGNPTTVQTLTSNLAAAGNTASSIDVEVVCKENYGVCGTRDNDTDTDFATALSAMNNLMPNPGTGVSGGSPQ